MSACSPEPLVYFKNYKRKMLSLNSKYVQHVKIYLACNFKVNLITRLEVIALFHQILKMSVYTQHLSLIVFEIKDEKY
jgi:hypothetical protein